MIDQSADKRNAVRASQTHRVSVALIGAVAVALLAPLFIPNRAFQAIAGVSAAIILWDYRVIANFYVAMAREIGGRFHHGSRFRRKIDQPWPIMAPSLLFCGIILWLLLNIAIRPVKIGILRYDTLPVLLGCLVLLLVLPSLYAAAMRAGQWFDSRPNWAHGVFLSVVLAACFYAQLTIALAIYVFPGWDAGAVLGNAIGLADGSLETLDADYFAKYPNNIFLTLLLAVFSKIMLFFGVTDLLAASVVSNVVVLLCGVLLTYLLARRLAGTGGAILSLLPSTAFVVLSPWIAVPYSDSYGLLFPVMLMYLYVRALDATRLWPRVGLWAAMGLVGLIGFNIKPTVVFVLAGVAFLTLSVALTAHKSLRQFWSAVMSVLVAVVVFGTGTAAVKHVERNLPVIPFDVTNNPQAVPFTHFLKMGATGSGGFNEQDVLETVAILDPQERFNSGLDIYKQRVVSMGPLGYADFLTRKALSTFGDGTFGMWSEGVVSTQDDPFLSKDTRSRSIQDYLWVKGPNFQFTTSVWQSFWFVILLLVALPIVLRGGRIFSSSASVMRISLLGLFLFQLFFETRARYLYLYVPFFILLAVLTLDLVVSRISPALPPKDRHQQRVDPSA